MKKDTQLDVAKILTETIKKSRRNKMTIISIQEQIDNLQFRMGLNISEIAKIMLVTRSTIYNWIKYMSLINRKNQIRLDLIHSICEKWEKKNVGILGQYKYKKPRGTNKHLIDLLCEPHINIIEVISLLDEIAKKLLIWKEISKEQRKKWTKIF